MNASTRAAAPGLDIAWLIDPSAEQTPKVIHDIATFDRTMLPIPPEIGQIELLRLPVADGISFYHAIHRFQPATRGQPLLLGEFQAAFPECTFATQAVRGGDAKHRELHPPADLTLEPGQDLFRFADRFHTITTLDRASDFDMTALMVSATALRTYLDDDHAQRLLGGLGLDAPPAVKTLPMPLAIAAPLWAAFAPDFQGSLRRLFAQSKTLEYLCGLYRYLTETPACAHQPPRLEARLQELHDYLIHLDGALPDLETLAARFGMSARRINEAFAQRYGLSIHAFLVDWRLNAAYLAVRDSALPLKTLAERLGYSHVNHFSRAFRNKFGQPPGQLRRGRGRTEDDAPGPDRVR
jgi:AraC-like DNA-binding protein